MVTCLGNKEGTNCYHRTRSPQQRENWIKWQLCYKCARELHPEYYVDTKDHGVRPLPGDTQYSKTPFTISVMPVSEIHISE